MTAPSMVEVLAAHYLSGTLTGSPVVGGDGVPRWICACEERGPGAPRSHSERLNAVAGHRAHLADALTAAGYGHVASVARDLLATARREGARDALNEAAEDVAYQVRRFEVGCEADAGYYDAHMEIGKHLRDLAARIGGAS